MRWKALLVGVVAFTLVLVEPEAGSASCQVPHESVDYAVGLLEGRDVQGFVFSDPGEVVAVIERETVKVWQATPTHTAASATIMARYWGDPPLSMFDPITHGAEPIEQSETSTSCEPSQARGIGDIELGVVFSSAGYVPFLEDELTPSQEQTLIELLGPQVLPPLPNLPVDHQWHRLRLPPASRGSLGSREWQAASRYCSSQFGWSVETSPNDEFDAGRIPISVRVTPFSSTPTPHQNDPTRSELNRTPSPSIDPMPLYMDVHPGLGDATPEDVAAAHQRDLEIQDEFGVRFLSYWVSAGKGGKAFCLVDSPDEESLKACHKAAHGLMPHDVIEVEPTTLGAFMGLTDKDENDRVTVKGVPDTALRAIMFTDIAGSTEVSTVRGDRAALDLLRRHDKVVRDSLDRFGGREVKHTGDGVFASFNSVLRAVEASIAIQRDATQLEASDSPTLAVKIGLSVGEPVEDSNDLFGASVNLAARLCAHAEGGQILTSSAVRDLTIGKGFAYEDQGEIGIKGFPEAVHLYTVDWTAAS